MKQAVLNFHIHPHYSFESFFTGHQNLLAESLRQISAGNSDELQVVVWGPKHTGKTHLLQAVIHAALNEGRQAMFLPLSEFHQFHPEMLQGLEAQQVIAVDDMDAIAGHREWEQALVALIDRWRLLGIHIVSSLQVAPSAASPFCLADLNSRLCWGSVHKLGVLSDGDLQQALQLHAKMRGMQLPEQVIQYLLTRRRRDMGQLVSDLEVINIASLSQKKKVTVDLVRKLLADGML